MMPVTLPGPATLGAWMAGFAFLYPLAMAYLWMTGAAYYWLRHERPSRRSAAPRALDAPPRVAIVIPCHDESGNVRETIAHALATRYPDFEVIAVNDGSRDDTGAILDRLAARHARLRVIHLLRNQGKAAALNTAALMTRAEFLVCIDGDAVLDPDAVGWMMAHFRWPRIGAVTGNPRVRTRSTLLGRLQVGEFSSTIGLIKRSQRTFGKVFTVSGVIAAFRKRALHDVGYWSTDMLTEDVDISWKLQMRHWDVRFEPNALCWILMPETLRGLWRQRLRWSTGGMQVLLKNAHALLSWRQRRMWPVYLEYLTSAAWAYTMFTLVVMWLLGTVLGLPVPIHVPTLLPQWTGVVIGTTCLIQVALGMAMDARHERHMGRYYFWMIWYPLAYWMLSMFTTIVGVPRAMARSRGERARWKSPDRGVVPGGR